MEPPDGRWGGPQPDGTVTGMIGEVAGHRAHLAIDEITITGQRETVVDFTHPYFTESTTLVSRAPAEKPRSLAVFYPFSFYLWGLLMVLTLLMGPVVYLVNRGHELCLLGGVTNNQMRHITAEHQPSTTSLKKLGRGDDFTYSDRNESIRRNFTSPDRNKSIRRNVTTSLKNKNTLEKLSVFCFNVFRTLVIQGNRLPAVSWPTRTILFAWYMFCLILYALYAGTLTAYMTKPSYEQPIDSLENLLEAGQYGFVPAAQAGTSNQAVLKNAKSGVFKALWENTDPSRSFPPSGKVAMEKVLTEKIVYMSSNLNSEVRATQRGRHRFHLARNTFFPQGYGIACRPGSPFIDVFDIFLGRMVQGGLVTKWVKDEVDRLRRVRGGEQDQQGGSTKRAVARALSIDHLQGAFYVLAFGSVLSAAAFFIEYLKHNTQPQ